MQQELSLTLGNDLREVGRANEAATAFFAGFGLAPAIVYRATVAIEEILSNVIRHGFLDIGRHEIGFRVRVVGGIIQLDVVDNGPEFDPRMAPVVDVSSPLASRRVGGLGIHLLRAFASEIRYERVGDENHLSVRIDARPESIGTTPTG